MQYKTNAKRCLGIDPGIANCGWAIVASNGGSRYKLIDKGTIRTKSSEEQPHRLETIYTGVSELLRQHCLDSVEIEAVFFNRNVKSCIKTASVIAVIELACRHADVQSYQLKPQTLKAAITGNGRADKDSVKYMVAKLMKVEVKSDHEADAIAAAVHGLRRPKINGNR